MATDQLSIRVIHMVPERMKTRAHQQRAIVDSDTIEMWEWGSGLSIHPQSIPRGDIPKGQRWPYRDACTGIALAHRARGVVADGI